MDGGRDVREAPRTHTSQVSGPSVCRLAKSCDSSAKHSVDGERAAALPARKTLRNTHKSAFVRERPIIIISMVVSMWEGPEMKGDLNFASQEITNVWKTPTPLFSWAVLFLKTMCQLLQSGFWNFKDDSGLHVSSLINHITSCLALPSPTGCFIDL